MIDSRITVAITTDNADRYSDLDLVGEAHKSTLYWDRGRPARNERASANRIPCKKSELSPNELTTQPSPMKRTRCFTAAGNSGLKTIFDRYMRNQEHFLKTVQYIKNNPVKAELCEKPGDWPFSSAWFKKTR